MEPRFSRGSEEVGAARPAVRFLGRTVHLVAWYQWFNPFSLAPWQRRAGGDGGARGGGGGGRVPRRVISHFHGSKYASFRIAMAQNTIISRFYGLGYRGLHRS